MKKIKEYNKIDNFMLYYKDKIKDEIQIYFIDDLSNIIMEYHKIKIDLNNLFFYTSKRYMCRVCHNKGCWLCRRLS